ncbi:MAG: hypothetical protein IKJ37_05915, partial [Kiritimatiellae bacterium]|nr:hypothetical protein [Kiritimatiellia bacterium]
MSTLFKSVLGAFAAVFATITAFAADAALPNGATEVAISTTAASVSHKGEMFAVKADESYSNYELPTSLQGTGTAEDPFLINNIDDLKLFRNLVNTYTQDGSNQFRGKYVKLMVDLDLAGENWEPIGKNSNGDHQNFLGHFDGNDKTISNLTIIGADHLGFFANVGDGGDGVPASVKNLNFHNVKISGTGSYVGTVIANGHATTIVDNVHVTGTIDISGKGYVGGLVGHAYIKMNDVSLIGSGIIKSSFWCCGGILGYAGEGSTVITNAHVEGIIITSAAGALGAIVGRAEDNNGTQPISGVNLSAKNVEIKTYTGDYGDSYSNNGIGYLYGGTATSNLSGNLFVDNVTLATSNGVNPTAVDAVASIGDSVYFSLSSAISALKDGDTVTLLGNCELVSGIDIDKNITVDGAGYKVYAANNANDTEMFNIRSKVTITNLTFDADHKFSYGIQVQNAADVTLSDVSILYAGNNNWGAAVNLNDGKLFVSGDFTAFSGGENGGAFPFTGILYWSGEFKFADGVTASIADPTGATTDSDLLLVGAVGLLSIEDANTFLSQFNIPSGFAPYTLALDADIVSSFGG